MANDICIISRQRMAELLNDPLTKDIIGVPVWGDEDGRVWPIATTESEQPVGLTDYDAAIKAGNAALVAYWDKKAGIYTDADLPSRHEWLAIFAATRPLIAAPKRESGEPKQDKFIVSEMLMAYVDGRDGHSHQNYAFGNKDEDGMRNVLALLMSKGWKQS